MAPFNQYWVGANGTYSTAGNWAGDNGAAVPLDGDSVYFTNTSVVSVTTALTLAGAGDSLALLAVGSGYTGAIGSSGSKLIAGVGITTIRMSARGGSLFVSSAATTDVILDAAGGITNFFEFAGTATSVRAVNCSGSWSITNGAAITNLIMSACPNCTCTVGTSVTALTRVEVNGGGAMSCGSAATSVIVGAGSTFSHSVGLIGTLRIQAGGVVRSTSRTATSYTTVIVEPGGIFDGRDNLTVPTVTIGTLEAYPGSSVYLNSGIANWRVTTDKNLGGNVVAQPGYTTAI